MTKYSASYKARRILTAARRIAAGLDKLYKTYTFSNHVDEITLHGEGYAELGYSDPACGVIATANWNTFRVDAHNECGLIKRIGEAFDKLGIECEWSDEWCACGDCGKLFRTSGDSYHWKPSFVLYDGEVACHECVQTDAGDHLKSLEGNCDTALTLDINPAVYGYVQYNKDSYETGWHPGQDDSPKKIAKRFEDIGVKRYLFKLDENEQFCTRWSIFIHQSENHLVKEWI